MPPMRKFRKMISCATAIAVADSIGSLGASAGASEKTLYEFGGGDVGDGPTGGLIADGAGNFYGMTGGGTRGIVSSGLRRHIQAHARRQGLGAL